LNVHKTDLKYHEHFMVRIDNKSDKSDGSEASEAELNFYLPGEMPFFQLIM